MCQCLRCDFCRSTNRRVTNCTPLLGSVGKRAEKNFNFPAPPFNHISGICKNLADTWPAATRVLSRGRKREDPENEVVTKSSFCFLCRHVSAAEGHLDVVKFLLLQPGTNINARDKNDFTPLLGKVFKLFPAHVTYSSISRWKFARKECREQFFCCLLLLVSVV